MTKPKSSKRDKTQQIKIQPNSKTQNMTTLKNSKCDKTQKNQTVTKIKNSKCDTIQKLKG